MKIKKNKFGTILPKVVDSIFEIQNVFTVDEIAIRRGLNYKSVKKKVEELVEEGYLTKTPQARKTIGKNGGNKRGRPKDEYRLVDDYEKIWELRRSVPRYDFDFIPKKNSYKPTSDFYIRATNALNRKFNNKEFTDENIPSIRNDLDLAYREEKMSNTTQGPLIDAYFFFQRARLAYIQGNNKRAMCMFTKAFTTFKECEVSEMEKQVVEEVNRFLIDIITEVDKMLPINSKKMSFKLNKPHQTNRKQRFYNKRRRECRNTPVRRIKNEYLEDSIASILAPTIDPLIAFKEAIGNNR